MAGLFGGLFDFNHDGKMGCFERTMEFATFASIMDEAEKEEKMNEIESAGLDIDELEFMDEDERREALEDAGFDFDDFY